MCVLGYALIMAVKPGFEILCGADIVAPVSQASQDRDETSHNKKACSQRETGFLENGRDDPAHGWGTRDLPADLSGKV